jgi:hypothetical protein
MAYMQGCSGAAAPGDEQMIRQTRLAAAFAFAAGLTAAGAGLAQTQSGGAATPAASAQPTSPAGPSTPASTPPSTLVIKPAAPDANQPTYSVNPPPDSSSGLYLPSVVGGYVKSAAGCVVVGCDDGPSVGGASGSSSSGSDEPPPPKPGPSGRQ